MKTDLTMKFRDVRFGKNVKIFGFVNLYGCEIGDNTKIGSFVEVQKGVIIGKNCKISSHSFLCEGVEIEDGVFIGHGVMFTNDKYPRAINRDGSMKLKEDWVSMKTRVKKGASIGSGTTILPGITIGENAMIGAGSVVTKGVPKDAVWAGCPAKPLAKKHYC